MLDHIADKPSVIIVDLAQRQRVTQQTATTGREAYGPRYILHGPFVDGC